MPILNNYGFRLGVAAGLVGFGVTKLFAQLFLGNWEVTSAGHPDIAARGVWLLAAFLPAIAVGSLVVTVVLVTTLMRRTELSRVERRIPALLGGGVGVAVIFFGADPTARALNLVSWPSSFFYYVVSAVVALVICGAGVLMVTRIARVLRVMPAAA